MLFRFYAMEGTNQSAKKQSGDLRPWLSRRFSTHRSTHRHVFHPKVRLATVLIQVVDEC